jgi:branched-chain amino acid transport system substrate-binding protein
VRGYILFFIIYNGGKVVKKRILKVVLLSLLVLVTLANCSKSKEASGSAASAPVRFALVAPITGDAAEYGTQFRVGSEIALEKINAAGGINGREVKLEIYDSKNDPKESAEIARRLGQDAGILAVIGDFSSTSCMAAAPIYEENHLIQLSPSASNPGWYPMGPYQLGTAGLQAQDAPYAAQVVIHKYLGAKTAAVIYLNTDWGLSAFGFFKDGAAEVGLEVVASEPIATGEKDFTAILSKIRQARPDVIHIMANYTEVGNCVKQIRQMGWDVQVVPSGSSVTDQVIQILGADAEGLVANLGYVVDPNDPPAYAFAEEFARRVGFAATFHGIVSHDSVTMLCEAARTCTNLTRENLRDALASYKGFVGLNGPIEFAEDGSVYRKYKIVGVKDQKWVALEGFDYGL